VSDPLGQRSAVVGEGEDGTAVMAELRDTCLLCQWLRAAVGGGAGVATWLLGSGLPGATTVQHAAACG
jgi:hypothetical protein